MKRKKVGIATVVLLLVIGCGGSDGGPTAPPAPSVAGVYSGANEVVANTCTGEVGQVTGVRSVSVTQEGGSIRITLAGFQLRGTVESSGAFTATGGEVIDGVTIDIRMEGSMGGGRFLATERATFSAEGESCTIVVSFNMVRE